MASDDDKPRGRGSDGDDKPLSRRGRGSSEDDPPSGRRGRGSGSSESESKSESRPESKSVSRSESKSESKSESESPRRRFGFRRRSREDRDDDRDSDLDRTEPDRPGRRVASLTVDDSEHDDLSDLSDLPDPPRFRRPPWWMLLGGFVLLLIVSSALYGEFNTERYFLVCTGSKAEAHRGRGFPWPFGHVPMVGSQYRSVPLGGDSQCQTQELDSEAELQHALLKLLLVEAERLSHKTRSRDLARARQMLNQGFGLARNYKKERLRLEGLRATLEFARARVVMRELETTLGEARRLFTRARSHSKQHNKEAVAWIRVLDRMLVLLRRRVAGDPAPPKRVGAPPAPAKPDAMAPGPARPVVPGPGSGAPDAMKPGADTPPARVVPQISPDAGVSGGGILL